MFGDGAETSICSFGSHDGGLRSDTLPIMKASYCWGLSVFLWAFTTIASASSSPGGPTQDGSSGTVRFGEGKSTLRDGLVGVDRGIRPLGF
jgi:hypothetical protein